MFYGDGVIWRSECKETCEICESYSRLSCECFKAFITDAIDIAMCRKFNYECHIRIKTKTHSYILIAKTWNDRVVECSKVMYKVSLISQDGNIYDLRKGVIAE